MYLSFKEIYMDTKSNFKIGDRIIFNADGEDPENVTSIKPKRMVGTIVWIGPFYTLLQLSKYKTCITNHQMLTDKGIRRLSR